MTEYSGVAISIVLAAIFFLLFVLSLFSNLNNDTEEGVKRFFPCVCFMISFICFLTDAFSNF